MNNPGISARKTPRAVGYVRVSTIEQQDAMGPAVQRAAIKAHAKDHGYRLTEVCEDAITGTAELADRDGLGCVLDAITEGRAEIVIVFKLDRLARDMVVQESLLREVWRHGATVESTSASESAFLTNDPDDPSRKLIRQILGAVSEYEREMIVLRTKAGRRRKAREGGYAGGAPRFGQRAAGGELITDEREVAVRETFARWRDVEGMSLRRIVDRANAEGVPAKRGGRWHLSGVSRVLSPPAVEADRVRVERARRARVAAGKARAS